MNGFHMPSLLLASGGAKDYAAWLAHITARSSGRTTNWSQSTGFWDSPPLRIIGPVPPSGSMTGSPYGDRLFSMANPSANTSRVLQHALPSLEVYNAIVAAGGAVIIDYDSPGAEDSYAGRNRNGFTSSSGAASDFARRVFECSYWNPLTNAPETVNPYLQTGPVPYSHPDW